MAIRSFLGVHCGVKHGELHGNLDLKASRPPVLSKNLSSRTVSVLLLMAAIAVGGCATWKDSTPLTSLLNPTQPPPAEQGSGARGLEPGGLEPGGLGAMPVGQSVSTHVLNTSASQVVLEVEFLNLDLQNIHQGDFASLWQWVDETALDHDERYRLIDNGMRAGLVADETRFRDRLQSMTTGQDVVDDFLASASVASDVNRGSDRVAMRMGRRYELPLRKPIDGPQVTLVRMGDQNVGRTLDDPQYLFAMQAIELTAQRRLRLRLRPEIQHGQMRQKFVGSGSNSALRIDQRRQTWSLPELDLHWLVEQDDLIVITGDHALGSAILMSSSGLAAKMFSGKNADHREEQMVLLIRVSKIPASGS